MPAKLLDSQPELAAAVGAGLYAAVWAMRTQARRALDAEGLTPPQTGILWFLQEYGKLSLGRLAELQGVTQANVTGIVDRLERKGLVARSRDTKDKRVTYIRLTEEGMARTLRARQAMEAATSQLLGDVPAEQLRAMLAVLNTVRERADRMNPKE